jgi:hypothetical protein
MSKKGVRLAEHKKFVQKVNKQENKAYYQNGSEQKNPRSENERKQHRTVSG